MNYGEEMASIRKKMKSIMVEFNQTVKYKSRSASRDPQIRNELFSISNEFAKKYNDLQSKYMDLQFLSDIRETAGENTVNLFLRFKMAQNSKNN